MLKGGGGGGVGKSKEKRVTKKIAKGYRAGKKRWRYGLLVYKSVV